MLSWSRGKRDHICFKKESFSEEWSRIEGFTADVTAKKTVRTIRVHHDSENEILDADRLQCSKLIKEV